MVFAVVAGMAAQGCATRYVDVTGRRVDAATPHFAEHQLARRVIVIYRPSDCGQFRSDVIAAGIDAQDLTICDGPRLPECGQLTGKCFGTCRARNERCALQRFELGDGIVFRYCGCGTS